MKKRYTTPVIKGHKIVTPHLLQASQLQSTNDDEDGISSIGNNISTQNNAKSYNHGSLFDDEQVEKNDFAYGL